MALGIVKIEKVGRSIVVYHNERSSFQSHKIKFQKSGWKFECRLAPVSKMSLRFGPRIEGGVVTEKDIGSRISKRLEKSKRIGPGFHGGQKRERNLDQDFTVTWLPSFLLAQQPPIQSPGPNVRLTSGCRCVGIRQLED